jgi:copper chaperone NosL
MTALTIVLGIGAGCSSDGPTPVPYDHVECQYCRMRITDRRYGGELVTRTGRTLYFDSIECLAGYVSTLGDYGATDSTAHNRVWVTNYAKPGTLIAVRDARFIRAAAPVGEMGRGVLAIDPQADSASIRRDVAGTWVTWADILADARHQHAGVLRETFVASR